MAELMEKAAATVPAGPAKFESLAHVSLPCRDLAEGRRFYEKVLGGELRVATPTFLSFTIAGANVGIGDAGCTFMAPQTEYPHIAFYVSPGALADMRGWLAACGIPTSPLWTRRGSEALTFFRDPSGNVIELYCEAGWPGADALPKGPPRGHGTTVDIDTLRYTSWRLPE